MSYIQNQYFFSSSLAVSSRSLKITYRTKFSAGSLYRSNSIFLQKICFPFQRFFFYPCIQKFQYRDKKKKTQSSNSNFIGKTKPYKPYGRYNHFSLKKMSIFRLSAMSFSSNFVNIGKKKEKHNISLIKRLSQLSKYSRIVYRPKWNYKFCLKRQVCVKNSLKGVLLVNFPEKEKNFLIKNLAAENKIPLITQSASLLLKDSRNMDDLLGVDDPIQVLFDKIKTSVPCICVRAVQNIIFFRIMNS